MKHISLTRLFWSQLICILIIGAGITIEYIYKEDLGFLAITVGSLIFSLTCMAELYFIINQNK